MDQTITIPVSMTFEKRADGTLVVDESKTEYKEINVEDLARYLYQHYRSSERGVI